MSNQGKFTLTVDSSQMTQYLECPQKWINYSIKRLEPVYFEPNENMNKGTYGHKLLEIYYRMKAQNASLNNIFEAINTYDPDIDVCECGCSKDFHCPVPILNIYECRKCKRCLNFRPHPFYLNPLDRSAVKKRIIDYANKYQDAAEDIVPLSEKHVEIGFSELIYEDSENLFILEGRIDVIGKKQGLDVIMDHKVQDKTHWLYPKSIQFKNYALIAQVPIVYINYVRLAQMKSIKDPQKIQDLLAREMVSFFPQELAVWRKRLVQIFFRMKKTMLAYQQDTKDGIERNWNSCSGKYMSYNRDKLQYCQYTQLCEEIDPRIAEAKEKQLFKINENVWKPW